MKLELCKIILVNNLFDHFIPQSAVGMNRQGKLAHAEPHAAAAHCLESELAIFKVSLDISIVHGSH